MLATLAYDGQRRMHPGSPTATASPWAVSRSAPHGRLLTQTFTLPGSHTITDTLPRSQTARSTRAVAATDGAHQQRLDPRLRAGGALTEHFEVHIVTLRQDQ